MARLSDEQIWRSVLGGDDSAFAAVWDRRFDRLVSHAVRLGSEHADAEELAALSLLEAWRRRHRVRFVDGSLLPWLLVTTSNLHRNSVRARSRYARVLARLPRPESAPDPASVLEGRTIDDALQKALGRLSPDDVALLVLVALEGLAVKDAAQLVGVKESTGRMRLARMRNRLQNDHDVLALMEGGNT